MKEPINQELAGVFVQNTVVVAKLAALQTKEQDKLTNYEYHLYSFLWMLKNNPNLSSTKEDYTKIVTATEALITAMEPLTGGAPVSFNSEMHDKLDTAYEAAKSLEETLPSFSKGECIQPASALIGVVTGAILGLVIGILINSAIQAGTLGVGVDSVLSTFWDIFSKIGLRDALFATHTELGAAFGFSTAPLMGAAGACLGKYLQFGFFRVDPTREEGKALVDRTVSQLTTQQRALDSMDIRRASK